MSRILFFVSSMQGGGAERVAALLCNHWATEGHEVTLVPTFSGRGECAYALDSGVCVRYLADIVGKTGSSMRLKLSRLRVMRSMIKRQAPDVVLSFLPHVNVAVLLAARGLGVPVVVSERAYPPAMPIGAFLSRLRRLSYPWAHAVVMQTQRGQQWLAKAIPRASGVVIANPCIYPLPGTAPVVDPDAHLPEGRSTLLAVGRLSEEKGHSTLLSAFAALARIHRGWDLVILGEGLQRAALEEQVHALGLEERVFLPGRVGNLHDWYRRADLYVMSSRFEGFPNALMEAMAYGLPVVSFDCDTGPADLIEDGVSGCLVPPGTGTAGLVDRLGMQMADPSARRMMGERAKSVRQRYAHHSVMQAWSRALGLNL